MPGQAWPSRCLSSRPGAGVQPLDLRLPNISGRVQAILLHPGYPGLQLLGPVWGTPWLPGMSPQACCIPRTAAFHTLLVCRGQAQYSLPACTRLLKMELRGARGQWAG